MEFRKSIIHNATASGHEGNIERDINVIALSKPFLQSNEIEHLLLLQNNYRSSIYKNKKRDAMNFIMSMIKNLKLPLKIFQNCSYYYQRFFLFYPFEKYSKWNMDIALTCLFISLKSSDSIKKLNILIQTSNKLLQLNTNLNANGNLSSSNGSNSNNSNDIISSNSSNPQLDIQRKRILDIEKIFLELGCFEFRNCHYCEDLLIKFAKLYKLPECLTYLAWNILTDLYSSELLLKYPANYNALIAIDLSIFIVNQMITSEYSIVNDIEAKRENIIEYDSNEIHKGLNSLLEFYLENYQYSFLQESIPNFIDKFKIAKGIDSITCNDSIMNNILLDIKLKLNTQIIEDTPLSSIDTQDLFFNINDYYNMGNKLNSVRFMYNKGYYLNESNN